MLDSRGIERAVLVGHSMGAATAIRVALEQPERVAGLVQITPAYAGEPYRDDAELAYWDRLAAGLEADGADGFMRAFEPPADERWRESVLKFTRQRIERHRHPEALAQAVRVVPRSEAFDGLDRLAEIDVPALVVGSRDESDPTHPLAVAEEYARRLPARRARGRGRGRAAARLAGRAALARDSSTGSLVQDRAQPDDRRALLDGDLVVLRRPHREPLEAVLGGELGEPREVAAAVLRAARRTAASSSGRRRATGSGRRSRRARPARSPAFPSSPATFT